MGRTALVTGGTGGLGAAVTDAFLADGWRVVVPTRPNGGALAAGAQEGVELVEADLFEPTGAAQSVEVAAREADAPVRALVNLIGGYSGGARVEETSLSEFEAQLTLNLRPTFLAVSAALPQLKARAPTAIVCVSSRAAIRPFSGAAGYISAKAAVIAFAQSVAAEYAADGVRCNALLPSVIDTPANRRAQPDADRSSWVSPERVAALIRFLSSSDSQPLSGAAVPAYGP
jgi:NAD(P)-dependent dehydrogenase (short-subunit alcohol dehydrogenase family)